MMFEFTEIERGKGLGGYEFPEKTLRLGKKTMSLSSDQASQFNSTRYVTEGGIHSMRLGIAFDMRNQAIKITSNPDGFNVRLSEQGLAYASIPVNMKRSGLPQGDYKAVEGQRGVYQLVR